MKIPFHCYLIFWKKIYVQTNCYKMLFKEKFNEKQVLNYDFFLNMRTNSLYFHSLYLFSQVAYFVARGVSPDLVDRSGMTPLMWAVWKICSLDPTRLLLTLGASPNLPDQQGNTALHWAILARNSTAISTLILQVIIKDFDMFMSIIYITQDTLFMNIRVQNMCQIGNSNS